MNSFSEVLDHILWLMYAALAIAAAIGLYKKYPDWRKRKKRSGYGLLIKHKLRNRLIMSLKP